LREYGVIALDVVGNRESQAPGIGAYVAYVLTLALVPADSLAASGNDGICRPGG
jgi:hypothetical protein